MLPEKYYAIIEAEKQLLGALMLCAEDGTREAINKTYSIIRPQDFLDNTNARIYSAMLSTNLPPSYIAIAQELSSMNRLKKNDCVYLVNLVKDCYCTPFDYEHYANIIRDYSRERQGNINLRVKGAL